MKQNDNREESTFDPGVTTGRGSSRSLRGELGVAGRREASAQVLEDVKRQATHQRDGGHLPQERHRGDKMHVWAEEETKFREEAAEQRDYHRRNERGGRQNDGKGSNCKASFPNPHDAFILKPKEAALNKTTNAAWVCEKAEESDGWSSGTETAPTATGQDLRGGTRKLTNPDKQVNGYTSFSPECDSNTHRSSGLKHKLWPFKTLSSFGSSSGFACVRVHMRDHFSGDECLHAAVKTLLQKACKRTPPLGQWQPWTSL